MSRFGRTALAAALGLALAAGCGKKDKDKDAPGGQPPGGQPPGGGPPGGGPPGGPPTMPGPVDPDQVLAKLPGGDEHAAGKKVYANIRCAVCHKLGETGGAPVMPGFPGGPPGGGPPGGGPPGGGPPGGGPPGGPPMPQLPSGPNLTEVGAKRTKDWIAEHIRMPSKHTTGSKMPAYSPTQISDADLAHLAAYLASRKPADPKPKDGKDGKDKDGKDTGGGAKKDPKP